MCLAIPGLITDIFEKDGLKMASVDFGGVKRTTCLAYTPEARKGSYVLVHVGFAINIVNEEEALATLEMLKQTEGLD
ncbi:MAG: HypC/HybG/HupF family hydrogenase formation chaperone [Candidatus Obscuribacterales bacterium]|nr:HypC/HybG/HupF family hydrogenase formation chaperone [Candidatus Obscuribacterales bacterium]